MLIYSEHAKLRLRQRFPHLLEDLPTERSLQDAARFFAPKPVEVHHRSATFVARYMAATDTVVVVTVTHSKSLFKAAQGRDTTARKWRKQFDRRKRRNRDSTRGDQD